VRHFALEGTNHVDISRMRAAEYRISHRHKDGAWGEMRPVEHSSVEHDPERQWGRGRLFKCTSCEEWAVIQQADEDGNRVSED
jgi:hypothetical protein